MSSYSGYVFFILLLFDMSLLMVNASRKYARVSGLFHLREQSPEAVDRTINLLEKPYFDITLGAAWVINHLLLAASALWILSQWFSQIFLNFWYTLGVVLLAALFLFLLEMIIERIILRDSQGWAVRLTPLGEMFYFLYRPFAWLGSALFQSSNNSARSLPATIEDELKNWVEVGQPEGTLEQEERQMIYSIFQFSDTLCREIMVPRIDVVALEASTPVKDAIPSFVNTGHSRIPVYEEVIDNVVGLLYAKDLLRSHLDIDENTPINKLLRDAYFVPEAKKVDELLREMQARGVHIAVVVDEYGGMAGLVSLEDIVEEIVGEIRDEYDQSEELLYQPVNDNEVVFHGRIDIDDFNEIMGTHLTRDIADTLGGYIYGQVGRVPMEGEKVELGDWLLTVEKVIGRRIRLVRAVRQEKEQEKENGKNNAG